MSPTTSERRRAAASNLLAGAIGGLAVLVVGTILIASGVIDTGKTTREVVRQPALTQPASGSGTKDGRTVADIYKDEGKGVVFVQARNVSSSGDSTPFGLPEQGGGTATGSGFLVDRDGTIVTNAHVVEGSSDVSVRFGESGAFIKAQVKGRDPSSDLAVLKIDPDKTKGAPPLPLGDSKTVAVGNPVVAIGNPFGFTRTVTTGIVSALARQITAPNGFPIRNVIQTDAAINPGNSGGPLLDEDGRVIGINSQIATGGSGSGSVGIGFAIPINTAKDLLPKLKQGGTIERAYLGIDMSGVTSDLAKDLNLPAKQGALIQTVVDGGPADKASLRGGRTDTDSGVAAGGDLLIKVDGKDIKTPDDVATAIADDKPGDRVVIEYYRGNDKRTVTVELGKRPAALPSGSSQAPDDNGGGFPLP
jgi:S1-C subfamily serine protease